MVLPPPQHGFRAYEVSPSIPTHSISLLDRTQQQTGWTPETDDDESPINYERGSGSAEGSKTDDEGGKVMENKVMRTIKEDTVKGTMPLLETVVDEKEKENIIDIKKVSTTDK